MSEFETHVKSNAKKLTRVTSWEMGFRLTSLQADCIRSKWTTNGRGHRSQKSLELDVNRLHKENGYQAFSESLVHVAQYV